MVPRLGFRREACAKIVYYGSAFAGRTTNLESIYKYYPAEKKGELVSIATEGDNTLFFDVTPFKSRLKGLLVRYQLYTVPGTVYYNATRKLVLQGVDGIVFVADSREVARDENKQSLENLRENLKELGLELESIPLLFQWNKRDLDDIQSIEDLERELNPQSCPSFPAIAVQGIGPSVCFDKMREMLLLDMARAYSL